MYVWLVAIRHRHALDSLVFRSPPHNIMSAPLIKGGVLFLGHDSLQESVSVLIIIYCSRLSSRVTPVLYIVVPYLIDRLTILPTSS